jgi:hypothetical protein
VAPGAAAGHGPHASAAAAGASSSSALSQAATPRTVSVVTAKAAANRNPRVFLMVQPSDFSGGGPYWPAIRGDGDEVIESGTAKTSPRSEQTG